MNASRVATEPPLRRLGLAGLLLSLLLSLGVRAAEDSSWPYANETPAQRHARMQWWSEARFGMFIHWGVYAVPAGTYHGKQIRGIGEWIMNRGKIPTAEYQQFAKSFNPVKYDPDAWVRLAKEAGMKYIVITSKHHDGFALFDSKVTNWDVVDATPYGKDLLKPLAAACRRHGIKLGFYYSQAQDWNHPGGAASGGHWDPAQDGDMDRYIREIAAPQVREILTGYGNIAVLWWDTPTNMNKERADMLQPLISLRPGIITNNRLGGGYKGDLMTPEQHIPATGLDYDWETCMTMNGTWGYKSYDNNWKSTEVLIRNLVDIASKGGNYLLNVGPTALGEIPQPSIERLKAIGKWMKVNGESIYETTASPFTKLTWGRCTKKTYINGAVLYAHVFDWPSDGKLLLPGLRNEVITANLLSDWTSLTTHATAEGVVVDVPAQALDPVDTVLCIRVQGDLDIAKVLPTQAADGSIRLEAIQADLHNPGYGDHAKVESSGGRSNIGFWTDARAWVAWSFKVKQPGRFRLRAEVAATGESSPLQVQCGDTQLDVQVPGTGDYDRYRTVDLAELQLNGGEQTLALRPIKKGWSPLNVRRVTLIPK